MKHYYSDYLSAKIALEKSVASFFGLPSDCTRRYSDFLYELVEDGSVNCEQVLKTLIYWVSEDDIKVFLTKCPDMDFVDCSNFRNALYHARTDGNNEEFMDFVRSDVEHLNEVALEIGEEQIICEE